MIITNKLGLPQAFVDACEKDYRKLDDNEFSITELNNGVKEIILARRHHDKIEVDAIDQFWALIGTAYHSIMEKGEVAEHEISESVLKKTIEINGKEYVVSGKFDLYDAKNKRVVDWKTSMLYSIEKTIQDGTDSNWFKQGRGYWLLLNSNGFKCEQSTVYALARDWSIGRAGRESTYAQSPIVEINWQFNNPDDYVDAMAYYTRKLELIDKYIDTPDDEIPECLPEERWEKKEIWAVWREGNKRATSFHITKEQAEFAIETLEANAVRKGKPYYVEYRKQRPAKCCDYCRVNKFCSFYKDWVANNSDEEESEEV